MINTSVRSVFAVLAKKRLESDTVCHLVLTNIFSVLIRRVLGACARCGAIICSLQSFSAASAFLTHFISSADVL